MSQRNVNLRSFNYGQQSQKIIDRSYLASANLINNIAKQQEEDRKRNEEAMLLGDATAEQLTLTIHSEGSAIVGTYTFEVAEQKASEAMGLSRANGFPLNLKIEAE